MNLKNTAIKLLVSLIRCIRKNKKPRGIIGRFLIVTTTGLGDTLWATPAINSLRKTYPGAYIGVLTSSIGKQVLQNNPHIDELFTIKGSLWLSLLMHLFPLRKKRIGCALIFHTSQRAILPFTYLLGPTQIIGSKGINKEQDYILTHALERKHEHEIERRLAIVEKVGVQVLHPLLELFPSKEDEKVALQFLEKNQIAPFMPLVGIHAGAKDKFKQWDPSCYIELGLRLKDHLGAQIILTGDASERALIEEISSQIPPPLQSQTHFPLQRSPLS